MNSILTVTTPATSYDLTVLATVKLELGIALTDSSKDVQLADWIHQASNAIASRCKRVFGEETISESIRRTGWGLDEIILSRRPVTSVVSVLEDGNELDSGFYEIDYASGIIYKLNDDTAYTYRCGWNDADLIVVNYVAGYELLGDLPYDIERACILLIKYFNLWSASGGRGGDMNIRAIEIPGVIRREWGTNNYNNFSSSSNSSPDLPYDVLSLISPYIEKIVK